MKPSYTKYTMVSLLNTVRAQKISATMKRRELNNFAVWQAKMRAEGRLKSIYPEFKKNGDLAELIGVVLGDGNIYKFPRTECLLIFSHSNNTGFIDRYARLVEKIFKKKPAVRKMSKENCVRVCLYEKQISSRLGVPSGNRGKLDITVPDWILSNKKYILRYLRGLYEAEGSLCIHLPTYTYKFLFANHNESMLRNVRMLASRIGFHPHSGKDQIQISRKKEVFEFSELIQFRKY